MKFTKLHRHPIFTSLLLAGIAQRMAPSARAEEPRWFRLNGIPEASVGMEVESSTETTRIGGSESSYEHMFITPLVGLQTSGSIYHPNLLTFDLNGELGWGWDSMTSKNTGATQTRNESDQLNRYFAQINLLQAKPYNASFFASQDHTFRDYGTFDTFTVDSERYGGRINWNKENLSLNTDFGYRDEKSTGLNDSSEIAETYFNFVGLNRRKNGQTAATFRFDQFDNIFNSGSKTGTMNESIGLSDSETFGRRNQITSATGISFGHSEYSGQASDTINANENVSIRHRPHLDSYLMLDFAHNHLHPETQSRLQGTYGLRHQLFDSLTSNLDAHGSHQENTSVLSSSTSDRYGLGLYESYTKRLRSWGRLTAGMGIVADHEEDNSTGTIFTSIDESHVLYVPTSPSYRPVYLNRPRVVPGTIQVNVAGDVLIESTDYQTVTSGELTEIRLIVPVSSHLQSLLLSSDNLIVLVTYQSASLNNASFESLNGTAQVRLDLPGGVGIYSRANWMENNAPAEILVQTLTDLVGGVDYSWHWMRAGAEYENYDSNFTQYTAYRFYQNFDFRIDSKSTLNFNFNETFYNYPDGRDQNQYQFLTRYSSQLWATFSWYIEGGLMIQEVLGTDQLQGSARTGFNWRRGKLTVRAGYEYNAQTSSSGLWTEEREKHRFFGYMKRTF